MSRDEQVLEKAERFLQDEVRPHAAQIDADPGALGSALEGLCRLDLMALRRGEEFGGPAVSEEAFRNFQESVARYSGSLAFLQTQHQSAGSMIAKSENGDLTSSYLPKMGNGEKLVGIGFSQLRRPGPPMMRAEQTGGGYLLNGSVPWITGWTFYPEFLIGATLPDGRAVFGVVPFVDSASASGSITLTPPMRLAAMESAQTVSGDFKDWLMPAEKVAFIKEPGWIANNDMINITLQGHFALGSARGALDVLEANAEKKPLPFLQTALAALSEELDKCRVATHTAQAGPSEETTQERLDIRAWAIDLAVRCAHAAVASSSGAANSVTHPAQRLYREALVYTVSAQTSAIMEATLKRITHRTK